MLKKLNFDFMKIITIEIPESVEKYLQRVRTVLPEIMASEPDEKLIPLLLEQGALAIESIPDEMFQSFFTEMGKMFIDKINNPNSQTINLPNN